MKIIFFISILQLIASNSLFGQQKKACDITDVSSINSILNTKLQFDPTSAVNKNGKFECRYTDPTAPGKYVAIGLLESKIQFGYDMLKAQFDANQKNIAAGTKAEGRYSKFFTYQKAGANAYYMTAPKDDFSPESFRFTFRKGDYIVTFSTEALPPQIVIEKIDVLFQQLSSKL